MPVDSLTESIQEDISNPDKSLDFILLKAKTLAYQLKNSSFKIWVSSELDGYQDNHSIPEYRILQTLPYGDLHSRNAEYKRIQIPLSKAPLEFQKAATEIRLVHGIKTIEELSSKNYATAFPMTREEIDIWTYSTLEPTDIYLGGYCCLQIIRPVEAAIFQQLLMTIRSRLQDFILELNQLPCKLKNSDFSSQQIVERLVNIYIFNNKSPMTTFNQENQQVTSQNNAGRDILIANEKTNINSKEDFLNEIKKLRNDIQEAADEGLLNADIADDVNIELSSIIRETKKYQPEKIFIPNKFKKAQDLLKNIAPPLTFVSTLANLYAAAKKIFDF